MQECICQCHYRLLKAREVPARKVLPCLSALQDSKFCANIIFRECMNELTVWNLFCKSLRSQWCLSFLSYQGEVTVSRTPLPTVCVSGNSNIFSRYVMSLLSFFFSWKSEFEVFYNIKSKSYVQFLDFSYIELLKFDNFILLRKKKNCHGRYWWFSV